MAVFPNRVTLHISEDCCSNAGVLGNLQLPVSEIEGIGPRLAGLLEGAGLHVVGDLLRVPSNSIHAATDKLASVDQARAWRQMAALLEIPSMNPQWAEALVLAGLCTLTDLASTDFNQFVAHFDQAKATGKIPTVPDAATIAGIMAKATALANTGTVTGTVTDATPTPVAGARVQIGPAFVSTDARGRFRISQLPLRQKLLVVVSHPDRGADRKVLEAANTDAAIVHAFTLSPDSLPYHRSQLDGQRLPKDFSAFPVKAEEMPAGAIRQDDLFKVILFYADGRHAKLTSKLLTFDDGVILVHWAKVPLQDLPAGIELRDHLIRRGNGWRKVVMNRQRLLKYKRFLRVKAKHRGRTVPSTLADRRALYDEVARELVSAKAL